VREQQPVQPRRRTGLRGKGRRLGEDQAEGDGPLLLAQQARLVRDREQELERLQAELGMVCYQAPGKRGKLRIVA